MMGAKMKAAPGVSSTGGGKAGERRADTSSMLYSITGVQTRQAGPIEKLLPRGAQNAVPTAELVRLGGFRSARELQKQIEAERAHGALILSRAGDGGGYFMPASRAEIASYEATLRRRALSTLRTLRAARMALREVEGQVRLSELDGGGGFGKAQSG